MRILLVDDEESILQMLSTICIRDGHSVRSTTSSIEAVDMIAAEEFDLVVTDLNLPHLDGLALVRRAHGLRPELQVMVITGYCGQYSLEEVLSAGVSDLLLKPFRAPEFRARLKLAEEQRQTRAQWRAARRELQEASAAMIQDLQRRLDQAHRPPKVRRVLPEGPAPVLPLPPQPSKTGAFKPQPE